MRLTLGAVVTVLVVAGLTVACSSGDGSAERAAQSRDAVDRPEGPAAVIAGPLEGGAGLFLATSGAGPTVDGAGYEEAEYSASGTATSYTSDAPLPGDGTYDLVPGDEADYATRIVVRRPTRRTSTARSSSNG
jgi:hypothetical protein